MITYSFNPQSSAEILSNSHRSPIISSRVYERYLNYALIVTNDNSSDFNNMVYDYSWVGINITLNSSSTDLTKVDFLSDPIAV